MFYSLSTHCKLTVWLLHLTANIWNEKIFQRKIILEPSSQYQFNYRLTLRWTWSRLLSPSNARTSTRVGSTTPLSDSLVILSCPLSGRKPRQHRRVLFCTELHFDNGSQLADASACGSWFTKPQASQICSDDKTFYITWGTRVTRDWHWSHASMSAGSGVRKFLSSDLKRVATEKGFWELWQCSEIQVRPQTLLISLWTVKKLTEAFYTADQNEME